jgi:hypothetical protein
LFGGFDEEGGAGEESGDYGGQDIVDLRWVSNVDYMTRKIGITG